MERFGDRAFRFALAANAPRRALTSALRRLTGVVDVVLTEDVGCVLFERDVDARDESAVLVAAQSCSAEDEEASSHSILTVYDGADLESVALEVGRPPADIVALHSDAEYRVAMLGFLPGFAYLTGLHPELRLPRRTVRPRVTAGSVAIAAEYTGVYPFASPGGWHLLGRASAFEAFDADMGRATLAVGDRVRFVPTLASDIPEVRREPLPEREAHGPYLEITRAHGALLLIDGGRKGRMHEGVPQGGALIASALARANEDAGNARDACAVEVYGTIEVTARGGTLVVADDERGAVVLREGERHTVSTEGRVRARVLALAGGIDAPLRLGSRSTLLAAGLGRPLRRGDRLWAQTGAQAATRVSSRIALPHSEVTPPAAAPAPIALVRGPDADDKILAELTQLMFRVSPTSDRTGTRLEGPLSPPAKETMTRRSTPMTLGAIERTPSGLIVLGPDHPTTGGYPVVAVVRAASLDAFMSKPLGSNVQFTLEGPR